MNTADPEEIKEVLGGLTAYVRKLRAEIRSLHRKLADANRGAEKNARVVWIQAGNMCCKDDQITELKKQLSNAN